jgi:glycosyltransferase involved in cell wall biosynthesis
MPTYNSGSSILFAIKSIINQTFCNWHLIVIDDGSTDGSLNLIKHITDSRVKIVRNKQNLGLSYRLNQGIDMVKSKYIVRMDSDDISFPTRFQSQFNFLESHPKIDLLATRALVFRGNSLSLIGLLPYFKNHQEIVMRPWKSLPMPHPTWMAKTSWFKKNKYKNPEVQRAEDQELLLRTYNVSKFHCLPDVLLAYRQGPFNLKRTLLARKSLLAIHIRYFYTRKHWVFLLKSLLIFFLKVVLDFFSALPGMNFIFFKRMKSKIPPGVTKQFYAIVESLKNG